MNRYEEVLLDEMIRQSEVFEQASEKSGKGGDDVEFFISAGNLATQNVMLLLRCIKGFREPVKAEPLESGCGKLVAKDE